MFCSQTAFSWSNVSLKNPAFIIASLWSCIQHTANEADFLLSFKRPWEGSSCTLAEFFFSFVACLNQPKLHVVPWNSPVNYHATPGLARNHTKHRQKEDKIIHTIPSCDTTSSAEPLEREWLGIKNETGKRLGSLQENTSSKWKRQKTRFTREASSIYNMMFQALDIQKKKLEFCFTLIHKVKSNNCKLYPFEIFGFIEILFMLTTSSSLVALFL